MLIVRRIEPSEGALYREIRLTSLADSPGFFYYDRSAYRQEQAVDGWNKLFAFLEKHLG